MNTLFTDEAQFTRDGVFNSRNSHVWAEENPHAIRESRSQKKFSINVWCGEFNGHLIGPYVLPNRLTGEIYLDFIQNILPVLLENENIERIIFQHDGAPPHFRLIVTEFLNQNFPGRWVGRGGPIPWPPTSPDFNIVDFFIWGKLKSMVYAEDISTEEQLLQRINDGCQEIRNNANEIRRAVYSLTKRARMCINKNGGHFEQFL